eukprot:CAMPEP_0205825366 /NCGR_PEP_ID=MMETSP0206-20130828/24946_1 /ASSEMBLY_ACC=CAM_ASM_000279 /TAXON_ID=36767 /ORGANISM="Euplotes focardii, Strain TN1" /LENGTH=196 /DNA_ID=CAMNT_0053124361 /DNA_START=300 /DNA_END=890 /DNA_ORIENTATION=+
MIKEDPNQVRFTQIDMAETKLSEWSPHRINVIKEAFKDIIDYCLTKENKGYIAAFKKMKYSEFLRRINKKNTLKSRLNELEEINPENVILNLKFSDGVIDYLNTSGGKNLKVLKNYGKIIRRLISIRNEIISSAYKLEELHDEGKLDLVYQKEDFVSMCELVQKLDGTKYADPHFIWNIPVRDKDTDIYNNCELSE